MSQCGDQTENWRGSYDDWLTHDRRNDLPEPRERGAKRPCAVCGGTSYGKPELKNECHTSRSRDAAANAARYRK